MKIRARLALIPLTGLIFVSGSAMLTSFASANEVSLRSILNEIPGSSARIANKVDAETNVCMQAQTVPQCQHLTQRP